MTTGRKCETNYEKCGFNKYAEKDGKIVVRKQF